MAFSTSHSLTSHNGHLSSTEPSPSPFSRRIPFSYDDAPHDYPSSFLQAIWQQRTLQTAQEEDADAGNLSRYRDWWYSKTLELCYGRGFQNSVNFQDLALQSNPGARSYVRGLAGSELTTYFEGNKTASQTAFALLNPFYVMLLFAILLMLLSCVGCCAFSKSFRHALAHTTRGFCFRDRPRRLLGEMSYIQLGAVVVVYVVFLFGGLIMFLYLVVVFAVEFAKGTTATQCAVARGTFEMIYGLYWSRDQRDWPMWSGTQTTYDRAARAEFESGANRPVFLNNIETANQRLNYFVTADARVFEGSLAAPGSLVWARDNYKTTAQMLDEKQTLQSCFFCEFGASTGKAIADKLSEAKGAVWDAQSYNILRFSALIANGSLAVARVAKQTTAEINKSLYFLFTAFPFQAVGDATAYILIALACLAAVAFVLLTVVLFTVLTVHIKRVEIPSWLSGASGCNWICYVVYAILILIIGGIALSLVTTLSEACVFTQVNLFEENGYPKYPRLKAVLPPNSKVATECMSEISRGNWTAPLGINDLDRVITVLAGYMESSFSEYMDKYYNRHEPDRLYANVSSYGWMFLIDSQKAGAAGEGSRLNTYPEVLNSGVQWTTVENKIDVELVDRYMKTNTLSTAGGGRLYGMQWIEEKINEIAKQYASGTPYANWCLQSNPNGCDPVTQVVVDQRVDVKTDRRVLTVFAFILKVNIVEANYWENMVFWAVHKQKVLQATTFGCTSRVTNARMNCGLAEYSPYTSSGLTPNEAAAVSNIAYQAKLFNTSSTTFIDSANLHYNTWKSQVLPYAKAQGTPLISLQDQQCRVGLFDYMSVITKEFCVYGNPYLGYAVLFLCCLIGIALIGWIFSYQVWHYLYDRSRMARSLTKMRKLQEEVSARRAVEMDADVFDHEEIRNLMQEMADGELSDED